MSGFDQIPFGPISARHTADTVHKAGQNVLRRAQDGQWPRQDVIDVMEALGLLAYRPGGRVGALGQRESLSVGEKRRRAETEESA